jgi:prevent-host-death family protein
MTGIGAYEAKTHLSELLERVAKGERFVITKHGRPVAALVPVDRPDTDAVRRSVDAVRAFRRQLVERGTTLDGLLRPGESLRDLAHEGHRY